MYKILTRIKYFHKNTSDEIAAAFRLKLLLILSKLEWFIDFCSLIVLPNAGSSTWRKIKMLCFRAGGMKRFDLE